MYNVLRGRGLSLIHIAEGVSFSILFMNLLTPLLDKALRPKVFGEVKKVNE